MSKYRLVQSTNSLMSASESTQRKGAGNVSRQADKSSTISVGRFLGVTEWAGLEGGALPLPLLAAEGALAKDNAP